MKTKYYRYTLKGEHSAEDAQRKIGGAAAQGEIVRVDSYGGTTQLYIASMGESTAPSTPAAASPAAASDIQVEEVSEKDVTKIGRE